MKYHINDRLKNYKTMLELLKKKEMDNMFFRQMFDKSEPTYQIYTKEFIKVLTETLKKVDGDILEVMAGDGRLSKHLSKKLNRRIITTDDKSWKCIKHPDWVEELEAIDAIKKYKPSVVIVCWEPYCSDVCVKIAHTIETPLMWIGEGQGGCCGSEELFINKTYVKLNDKDSSLCRTDYGFSRKPDYMHPAKHASIYLFNWPSEWLNGKEDDDWFYETGYSYDR